MRDAHVAEAWVDRAAIVLGRHGGDVHDPIKNQLSNRVCSCPDDDSVGGRKPGEGNPLAATAANPGFELAGMRLAGSVGLFC